MLSVFTAMSVAALGVVLYSSVRVNADVRNLRAMLDTYTDNIPEELFKTK